MFARLLERPPRWFRLCFPGALFRVKGSGKRVFLTFDDGPIPEATPWILETLKRYDIKATFFMVGDNVRKYPRLFQAVIDGGHRVGNHSMHHIQGVKTTGSEYLADVMQAASLIPSRLYRPPHGVLKWTQLTALRKRFRIVMYDLVTRDYSRHTDAARVVKNVKQLARPGAIIVFHDSLRSIDKLHTALPEAIEWLISQGYEFGLLDDNLRK